LLYPFFLVKIKKHNYDTSQKVYYRISFDFYSPRYIVSRKIELKRF